MSRKGRFLEVLVKQIQEFLGPQELEIKSPELFYRNGKQIGEIDVTIRGKLGSTDIFIGFECRDRPEDGPQGIPWLTQIHGKQQLLNVDKMIAVSTTGFVLEAIKVAEDFGIDLLTITSADNLELANWLYPIEFFWEERMYEVTGVVDIFTEPRNITGMRSIKLSTPLLKLKENDQPISLEEFIKDDLDKLFKQIPVKVSSLSQRLAVIQKDGRFRAELEGEKFMITKLAIPVKLSREVVGGGLILSVCRNINQDELIAVTGTGLIETSKRKFKILAIAKQKGGKAKLKDLKLSFLTENDEPYMMAAGTEIAIYSKQGK